MRKAIVGTACSLFSISSLLLGEDFVAGKGVSFRVVGADTVGVPHSLVRGVVVALLVVEKTSNITVREVTGETSLLILNLSSGHLIVVVEDGVVEEFLVEDGLEEELEVAHEARVVTILVLGEDGDEAEVLLVLNRLVSGQLREGEGGLDGSGQGDRPEGASNTHLQTQSFGLACTYTEGLSGQVSERQLSNDAPAPAVGCWDWEWRLTPETDFERRLRMETWKAVTLGARIFLA